MIAKPALPPGLPPALVNLTYISDCCIPAGTLKPAVAALVTHAEAANRERSVTGALLVAGNRFVQTLEGERVVVDRLMQLILQDPRHAALRVVDARDVPARNFPKWLAVYSGSSLFVSQQVSRALVQHRSPRDVERLLRLMREFGTPLPRHRH